MVVKRVFRCIKEIEDYGLWYPKWNDLSLFSYIDACWVDCTDDKTSASGASFYLGEFLVSWLRKEQTSISLSMIEE